MTRTASAPAVKPLASRIVALVFSWIVLLCIGGIARPSETAWVVVFGLYSILVLFAIAVGTGWAALPLTLGLVLRLGLMFTDLFTDIPVFSSGGDTENFYKTALSIYNNPQLFGSDLYGGVFPQLCGALFWLIGPSRIFVQYTNVLLSIIGFMFVLLAMRKLNIPEDISRNILFIACLMPVPASISAIFLRESLMFCLIAASFYSFVLWLRGGAWMTVVTALALVGLTATFHFGVLGLAVGYAFALLFYNRDSARFSFTIANLARSLPILLVAVFVVARFPSIFLEKLDGVTSAADAISIATESSGGSAYLTGMEVTNPITFVLFGGLKGLFLLISPVPPYWRGVADIVSFALDGVFYLFAIVVIIRAYRGTAKNLQRRLLTIALLGLVSAVLVFGLGTVAAGTAMRHRQKLLPVIAVTTALALTVRRECARDDDRESIHDQPSTSRRRRF